MSMLPQPRPKLPLAAGSSFALFWLLGFVLVQIVCQVALLFEAFGSIRIVFRIAAFAVSLLALVLISGQVRRHPSRLFLWGVLAVVALEIFHPNTNSALAAIAQFGLYLAVAAPLIWVCRLPVSTRALARVLVLLWGFHTVSALVGVMQSVFPGRFQPQVSTVIRDLGESAEGLKLTLADGSEIWRPMGLTDQPGGAATAGLYALMFGMGFVAVSRSWTVRGFGVAGMVIGLYCIHLSQIRAALVVGAVVALAFLGALTVLRRTSDIVRLLVVLPAVIAVSFAAALTVGGGAISGRLESLVVDSPDTIYYQNRGRFLEETLTYHLPEHPIGAGLGRWGMNRRYFADETNPNSEPIWAEIQWTAWVLDGGFPLALLYAAALVTAVVATARIARNCSDRWLAGWAALIAAYGVAVCAMTFGSIPFIGQAGMEFWFLNAAVWTAWRRTQPLRPASG